MRVASAALRQAGYAVEVLDLYAAGWRPVLDRHEFAPIGGPFKPQAEQMRAAAAGTLDADVRSHLDQLLAGTAESRGRGVPAVAHGDGQDHEWS